MELWIGLVIIAQLLYAITVVIDKYIVTNPEMPRPAVYAFYTSMLSIVAVAVLPFGFFNFSSSIGSVEIPNTLHDTYVIFGYSLISGITYILGILLLFSALRRAEASDVIPIIGSTSALTIFLLTTFILHDPLPERFALGFGLLVIGTALISHFRFKWRGLLMIIIAGFFFGVSTMTIKLVFNATSFVDGFFWTRIANVLAALFLLAWPPVFYAVTRHETAPARKAGMLIVASKVINGVAFILILVAISMGSIAIISAMQGLQFVFLLILASGCTFWLPLCFHDAGSDMKMIQKIIAIGIIVVGFFALFL